MSAGLETLAQLTPVALSLGGAPSIDWGNLGGVRFSDPFFAQTIERWAGCEPSPRLVRTPLDALFALDEPPSLDPTALIFHLSRCGSTLLSRLLATHARTLVISEPSPLNQLLMAGPAELESEQQIRLVRALIRAFARPRSGEATHYVVKLSSWNIMRLEILRRAFPGAKLIWVQRRPIEIMASILADPPGWMLLRHAREQAALLFGAAALEVAANGEEQAEPFCARVLAAMLAGACAADDAGALLIDYGELPAGIWQRVAPFIGLTLDEQARQRMIEESTLYSKDAGRRPFTGDPPERRFISDRVRRLAATFVDPLYEALDRRRALTLTGGGQRVSATTIFSHSVGLLSL
jgi:hypothetical protein